MRGLFVPGWGATAALYAAGLPEGWHALELPSFRAARGELPAYRRWLQAEIDRERAPLAIAGTDTRWARRSRCLRSPGGPRASRS